MKSFISPTTRRDFSQDTSDAERLLEMAEK
jgi:hypothetical protein